MHSVISLALLVGSCLAQKNMCMMEEGYSDSGYRVQNNLWGQGSATSGSQCSSVNSIGASGVAWSTTWQWSGGDGQVKSYSYSSRDISKKLVSAIASIPTSASWSVSNTATSSDVSYDLFTSADQNHNNKGGDYELMIWLARYGPIGPIGGTMATVQVGGRSWDLHYGLNGAMKVYSFVAASPISSFSGDIKDFFNYLTANEAFPASSQYVVSLQFGTEAFTGGTTTFDVSHWSADLN